MKHRNTGRPVATRRLFIRKGNEHGICVAVRLPNPPYLPIRKGPAPVTPPIGENKLRELMDSGELEYIQNGNRRLIADAAIWDWYHRAKRSAKPPTTQGG